jgi:hypothetical protein
MTVAVPNLIHPVRCVIRQTRKDVTSYDDDAREAIQKVARNKEVVIQGQPRFNRGAFGTGRANFTRGGQREDSGGYIVFRQYDLDTLCIELQAGDQVVQIGHMEVDMYIRRLQPTGHYTAANGASLIKAFIEDRAPARDRPGEL